MAFQRLHGRTGVYFEWHGTNIHASCLWHVGGSVGGADLEVQYAIGDISCAGAWRSRTILWPCL